MKIKNIKWILGLCICLCPYLSANAQHPGILLIQENMPFRKVNLKKGTYIKVKHGSQYTIGYLDVTGDDFINILPEKNSDVPLFDLTKEQPLMGYQIPIATIEKISKPKKFGKKVMTVVGSGFLVIGVLYSVSSIGTRKSRPDLSKPWGAKGLLNLAIGVPIVLGSRQKKYKINGDGWSIN